MVLVEQEELVVLDHQMQLQKQLLVMLVVVEVADVLLEQEAQVLLVETLEELEELETTMELLVQLILAVEEVV
tara:strand:+ start:151 stop:369 length:219 start_codon:yes stop_codon:yes gene_type:complete